MLPATFAALAALLDATLAGPAAIPLSAVSTEGATSLPPPLPPEEGLPPDPRTRHGLLPVAAAVVPGLVLHGSGHFVAGDRDGARRLLATQSVGLAMFAGGVAGLSLTGASRRLVIPFELAAITGVGLMGLTAMAGIYGVSAGHGGTGDVDPLVPSWQVGMGALYVRNPVFPYRWVTGAELEAWLLRMRLNIEAFATPDRETVRGGARGAYRLRGARPAGAGDFPRKGIVDLGGGVIHHRERRGPGPFDLTIFDLTVGGRFGLGWYMSTLAGSFVEWAAGGSIGAYHYGGAASTTEYNDALLLRFGYGFHLGRQSAPRGELLFVYDHHHDDFAGGLKIPGLGSGPAGHVGVEGVAFFSRQWGVAGKALFGAAHLYGLSLRWRPGEGHMNRVAVMTLAGAAALLGGCLGVADDRARRDQEIGRASGGGVTVSVVDGLAHVRSISTGSLTLWAQAPVLTLNVTRDAAAASVPLEITVDNALFDAVLSHGNSPQEVVATDDPRPTRKRWRLPATYVVPSVGDAWRLELRPPDADDRAPFRIAAFADVQERIDQVQEIFRRMNQDPRIRFVLMSGDLTNRGTADQLARFQHEMRTLAFPIFTTLGNHELGKRDDLFHDHFGRGSFSFAFRGARFTLLDSASATISPLTLESLEGWLRGGASGFHLVGMHIPPFNPAGFRGGGFASRLEAAALVAKMAAAGVDVNVYGHVHSFYAYSNAGIPAYITGGGGAIPERFDGIGRHFLTIDLDPGSSLFQVAVVRVD